MSAKTLKMKMQDELAALLAGDGFVFVKGEQRFVRARGGAAQIVHLSFVDGGARGGLSVIVNLAVRHERVEALVNSWREDLSAREKKATATLGAELGKILGRGQMRWTVASEEDCAAVAREIYGLVREHGLPYLEGYSDLTNVRERFSSGAPGQWHQFAGGRALRLPVVCALMGDPEAAQREFREQYDYLKSSDDLLARDYPSFVEYARGLLGAAEDGDG
jgi:hypothetical protein